MKKLKDTTNIKEDFIISISQSTNNEDKNDNNFTNFIAVKVIVEFKNLYFKDKVIKYDNYYIYSDNSLNVINNDNLSKLINKALLFTFELFAYYFKVGELPLELLKEGFNHPLSSFIVDFINSGLIFSNFFDMISIATDNKLTVLFNFILIKDDKEIDLIKNFLTKVTKNNPLINVDLYKLTTNITIDKERINKLFSSWFSKCIKDCFKDLL